MDLSLKKFIEGFEGREHRAYADPAGQTKLYSIGVGHQLTPKELETGIIELPSGPAKFADGLTDAQIDELLTLDIGRVRSAMPTYLFNDLNADQLGAIIDFTFNLGAGNLLSSTLLKRINAQEYDKVPDELKKWVMSGGLVNSGLKRRRDAEIKLWNGEEHLDA